MFLHYTLMSLVLHGKQIQSTPAHTLGNRYDVLWYGTEAKNSTKGSCSL